MSEGSLPLPPVAAQRPVEATVHGDTRIDEYAWLRDRDSDEVRAHLDAENAYVAAWFEERTGDLRDRLYTEMLARIKEDDASAPVWDGAYRYYVRTEQGKPYAIHCRAPRAGGDETILLDLNAMSDGGFIQIRGLKASPSHRYLSYGVDRDGSEIFTIEILDTHTMTVLDDRLSHANGQVAWIDDDRFLYTIIDEAHRPFKVFEHHLGAVQADDREAFHEPDGTRWTIVSRSRDGRWLFISTPTSTSGEVRFASADDPTTWVLVRPRVEGIEYTVDACTDRFWIHTNDAAPEFAVMVATPDAPTDWTPVIAGRDEVTIDAIDAFERCLVTLEREQGLHKVKLYDHDGQLLHEVAFPDAVYDVELGATREADATAIRLEYSSLNRPETSFDLHLDGFSLEVIKVQDIPGGYDPDLYETQRITATASDGTQIPISIVRHRDAAAKPGPLVLYGYGAYGFSLPLAFRATRIPLLDRGVTYALAHIRGGADLGEKWRNDGKYLSKMNTFTDFIACAEHLVETGWTTRAQMAICGGSAGGLLIGAVLNLRPDVARCALAWVPFVDSLNSMLDASLPLTENEYEEWGNPNDPTYYAYMKSYAPYENVADGVAFPDVFATAGLNDPRVGYWEPAKWVQRIRARASNDPLVLFRTNMGAGHAGAADRYEYLRESAHDWAFILERLGLVEAPAAAAQLS